MIFRPEIFFTTKDTTLAPHCVPWHRPPGQVWCSAGEVTKGKADLAQRREAAKV